MGLVANIRMVLHREGRRVAKRRSYLALLTLLPAVAFVVFGLLFIHPVTGLPIALLDSDNTPTSRTLASMVDATEGVDILYNVSNACLAASCSASFLLLPFPLPSILLLAFTTTS